jgi:hypothetical protein
VLPTPATSIGRVQFRRLKGAVRSHRGNRGQRVMASPEPAGEWRATVQNTLQARQHMTRVTTSQRDGWAGTTPRRPTLAVRHDEITLT